MLKYTEIEHSMEIRAAGDKILRGTAQGILLVVVHDTGNVLRKVKMPIVLVSRLKRNLFSSLTAAQKSVKAVIEKNRSSLGLGPFSVQLTRLDDMDHRDLTIVKQSRKTESSLCTISMKTFRKKSVLKALVPKKSVALSVSSIDIDQRVVENA